jgi:CBS domain-containing protein
VNSSGSSPVSLPNELVAAVEKPSIEDVTVSTLLTWFGAERRLPATIEKIRDAFAKLKIESEPDFEFAYLDAAIKFVRLDSVKHPVEAAEAEQPVLAVTEPWIDPTYRIGKLDAANRRPQWVSPDANLSEAITRMLSLDFSQLPVMTGERVVKGVVTWQSIASRIGVGQAARTIADVMEPWPEAKSEDSLFETLPTIERYGYVLVRASDQRIVGIVTATDVSVQFHKMTEPFLLTGEIENYVRRLLDGRFTVAQLRAFADPSRNKEKVNRVSDLSFGEYIRLLEDPLNWKCLDLSLDRALFVKTLGEIRDVRNNIMHFDPDGIGPKALSTLRTGATFFQRLAQLGVIKR